MCRATIFVDRHVKAYPHFGDLAKKCRSIMCRVDLCRSALMVYIDFYDIFLRQIYEFMQKNMFHA